MLKKAERLFLLIFPVLFLLSFTPLGAKAPAPFAKPQLKTIIIDAGHGLPDPGAEGDETNEAAITLAIALKAGKLLEDALPDCKIIYTRTGSGLPGGLQDLREANRLRARMANEAHGDLFISIHCNSTGPSYRSKVTGYTTQTYYVKKGKKKVKKTRKVPVIKRYKVASTTHGTETYIWAANRNDAKKQFVNTENDDNDEFGEKEDSSYHYFSSAEAKIMASLRTRKYFNNSLTIANFVEDEFVKAGRYSRGVKQRDWEQIWVLQATAMPSILIETGFISTPSDENYLNSADGQKETSICIKNAVLRYKAYLER
ncbi:N-acetylmuramoyl-L-alanine amidase [Filimonas lacunae]|uniref:N-acetylmuramoyl-L-alanine amidase n=1 Tax=Filimonas lacunae TaxID=477680 RepID=A0A173MEF2_9BACT|nr:N-acetylmuramoyl-L-alanine amidase [Filimonas lacunae]BAV05876.1 N-acetylmuramoyl-L-alanine amidase [Filimonas lacunae]SIT34578.1 N-acetylmuramoyl-L-alanine amidase [Filimonas lacunae]